MSTPVTINKVIVKDGSRFIYFDVYEDVFEGLVLPHDTVMIFAARCNQREEHGATRFDLDFKFAVVGDSVLEVIKKHLKGMPFCDLLLVHHEADPHKRAEVLKLAESLCGKD